jgi:small GTP-binding protein
MSITIQSRTEQEFAWGECQYTFKIVMQGLSGSGKS